MAAWPSPKSGTARAKGFINLMLLTSYAALAIKTCTAK